MTAWKQLTRVLSTGLILMLGALAFAAPTPANALAEQGSQTATWRGTLDAGGTKLRLEIAIAESAGELTGELLSLDQGNAKLALFSAHVRNTESRGVGRLPCKVVQWASQSRTHRGAHAVLASLQRQRSPP